MRVHAAIGRLPILVVIGAPFALEAFGVAGAVPELRLFEVNGLGSVVQGALHTDAEILAVVCAGAHVIDIAAVADLVAIALGLRLVLMVDAVPASVEIVLIVAPSHAGHDVDAIGRIAPGFDARRERTVNTINQGDIAAEIADGRPGPGSLETGALGGLVGVGGEGGAERVRGGESERKENCVK